MSALGRIKIRLPRDFLDFSRLIRLACLTYPAGFMEYTTRVVVVSVAAVFILLGIEVRLAKL